MPFTKVVPRKQIELDEYGYAEEVIDLKLQYAILPGESYQNVKAEMLREVDRCIAQLFKAELKSMPERLKEGERWEQMNMFGDAL